MQTDIDGKQTFSPIISINLGNKNEEISVFPNPASSLVNISLPSSASYEISLLNISGQLIYNTKITTSNNLVLNVSGYKAGVYFVRVIHDGITETKKLIINN